jgi:hypothetical protein
LVFFHADLGLLLIGCLAFLDGDGEVDFSLLRRGLDSWASLAAGEDDDLDAFLSFVLAFLVSSRILSRSTPSFFCFSLFCTIIARSA